MNMLFETIQMTANLTVKCRQLLLLYRNASRCYYENKIIRRKIKLIESNLR